MYLKFSDENIYKDTSILYNIDSYNKSKGLNELGKKERYISKFTNIPHISVLRPALCWKRKIYLGMLCILRQRKIEGNISDMEISKLSHHCLPIRDGGYDFIVWACLK